MLKVMTLNMNYDIARHGPWPDRRALIAAAIQAADADVVALQAVRRDPEAEAGLDQAAQLARLLPRYRYVHFQSAEPADGGTENGSAFLSRVPLAETDCLGLYLRPGLEDTNHRVLLRARVDIGGESWQIFNAHYSWVVPQTRDNLGESLLYIESFSGPALLVGDMNTLPDSDVWEPLQAAGWQDVWAQLCPEQPGYTFESDRPYMRIDYAWANPIAAQRVQAIHVVAREADGVRLSDHLGLVVTL
jgi:endonuclease/exonuclease/phosphatase family metal-dependent hydrolase